MKTIQIAALLSLFVVAPLSLCGGAEQTINPMPPIPPIPPMPHPPMPPVPPISTEEQAYQNLKDDCLQLIQSTRKEIEKGAAGQQLEAAVKEVANMNRIKAEYTQAKQQGKDWSRFPQEYADSAVRAAVVFQKYTQFVTPALMTIDLRMEQMKRDHPQRFEKDRKMFQRQFEPLRKITEPANDVDQKLGDFELEYRVRIEIRRAHGDVITPEIEAVERINAAKEVLDAVLLR